VVAELTGAGTARVPASRLGGAEPWETLLTSEDPEFAVDASPPEIRWSEGALEVRFERPGAIVLRGGASVR